MEGIRGRDEIDDERNKGRKTEDKQRTMKAWRTLRRWFCQWTEWEWPTMSSRSMGPDDLRKRRRNKQPVKLATKWTTIGQLQERQRERQRHRPGAITELEFDYGTVPWKMIWNCEKNVNNSELWNTKKYKGLDQDGLETLEKKKSVD